MYFTYLLRQEIDHGPQLLSKNEKITRQEICPPRESSGKYTTIVYPRTKIPEVCVLSTENYLEREAFRAGRGSDSSDYTMTNN